ncbi:Chitin synthase, class 3 [Pyricularia oryzae]|uniref:Chitin synthase 3 n=5 Tax=Pyricularia TaxID=48558 RepID=CHS3_PYRO7|nr:chitin synthase 3 [Pyricularia oryzae 70-15]KAH8847598.1 Chitin synthase, class 3 [Pyricularia oryzae]KAI6297299.1 Chitin synthase, class 3 [Pyricularia grisea]EHA52383.1 chitin synthase 3 [Pyricularia oryzae 70-15]KAH9430472.1 Chitin synthase, class 3 [Pyricularia oryzae]KAI6257953.1 Chitin synthase, class 3 [Pyricularia oryzae]
MAYNRLDDDYFDNRRPMNNRPPPHRTPSPGHPLQHGYQLDDAPYGRPGLNSASNLDIPMGPGRHTPSDQLQLHTAHSMANMSEPGYQQQPGGYRDEYSVNPEQHHDAYYNPTYTPTPNEAQTPYGEPGYEHDGRPLLPQQDSYGQYSDNPQQQQQQQGGLKRWKTVKRVPLYMGNLVLDCPVPPKLLNQFPHGERDEFTHMRYSAATCDPNDFYDEKFTLRQRLFSKPRETELFIVVTMYNEDEVLFARTMIGVFKNIEYMCKRPESKTWGKEAWKKIVVCIVSDGRAKINPRTRALLAGLGVYQEGIARQNVDDKPTTAHIYEYTTQIGMALKNDVVQLLPRQQPVQLLFCLKENNQKKINSHRWFFSAFGRVLNPNICVLLDAGTKPGGNSIYHLWKAFDLEPMCAGACGEIKAMLGTGGKNLFNPLVAAQNFEYKMSNILDKPLESAFGFISVLPGAFSAYRYIALQNDKNGQGPLEKYFAGEKLHGAGAGIFTANMYLAEDRILCFELVTKRNCHWILQYVKSATGETDVPDTATELILQRRRWLNGSFFAAIYAIAHFYQFFRSDHSFFRKIAFFIEFTFNTVNMIFAWFAIGNFFLVFKILTTSLGDETLLGTTGKILGVCFEWLYGVSLITCFVLAMGNRPAGSGPYYLAMIYFWAIIFCYLLFAAVFISVKAIMADAQRGLSVPELLKDQVVVTLILSIMSTYGIWLVASLLMFDPWHMFTSLVQYMLLSPTFTNVLNVYAFCNTHDISWGTKGDDKPDKLPSVSTKDGAGKADLPDEADLNTMYERELAVFAQKHVEEKKALTPSQLDEKQLDYYRGVRTVVVLLWMVTNFGLAAVVLSTAGLDRITPNTNAETKEQRATIYMAVVLYSVAALSGFKFIGAMWFLVVRMFRGV